MESYYSLKNLTFLFASNQKRIFENVNYNFKCNTLTMIKGKNGCGKSTLLKLFRAQELPGIVEGALVTPAGEYPLMSSEHKIFSQSAITFVDQQFDNLLIPDFTVLQNIACASFSYYPSCLKLVKKSQMPAIMKSFSIDTTTAVEKLSGGQRQILSMVMALENNPKILLLDEPTAALDYKNALIVMDFLRYIKTERNITIIMICHDPDLYKYADEIIELIS